MTQDEHDEREDMYEILCKEVTTLCECGHRADAIIHADPQCGHLVPSRQPP